MPVRLTLYAKARCSLCDDAFEVIEEVRRELSPQVATELAVVDITTDAALMAAYRYEIPVVLVKGQPAFKLRVDAAQLRARLMEAASHE